VLKYKQEVIGMKKMVKILVLTSLFIFLISNAYGQTLIDYVGKDDGCFSWEIISREDVEGATIFNINLVSQRWKDIVWSHRLVIGVPKTIINPKTGVLFITGSWGGYDSEEVLYIKEMTRNLGCVAAVLFDVPNQPLFGGLREDALIAYTLARYVETGDEEWPILLPMAKSAVRAMTATQEFSKRELNIDIEGFLVTGASKRGWTTWLTGACDGRVKGIAPMVYDNLNIKAQFSHQREIWQDLSLKLYDYTSLDLDKLADSPIGEKVLSIIDPYYYRERLTVPKLIINGSNDPYWSIDAVNFYLNDIPGEKYILYVPNSGHNLEDRERVLKDVFAFYLYTAGRIPFPKIGYETVEDDTSINLILKSDIKPAKVGLWYAESDNKNFVHSVWKYIEAEESEDKYTVRLERPEDKSLAFFGEFYYNIGGVELYLCTPASLR